MKEQTAKLTLPTLNIKSITTSTPRQIKIRNQKNDGGYTWVG